VNDIEYYYFVWKKCKDYTLQASTNVRTTGCIVEMFAGVWSGRAALPGVEVVERVGGGGRGPGLLGSGPFRLRLTRLLLHHGVDVLPHPFT
jgi:hypothetical protein